jgi:hypothetical protein
MRFVDRLFEILGDNHVGWNAARGIGEICSADTVLTKRNHARIKVNMYNCESGWSEYSEIVLQILYAQKFFDGVLPRVMQGGQSSRESTSLSLKYFTSQYKFRFAGLVCISRCTRIVAQVNASGSIHARNVFGEPKLDLHISFGYSCGSSLCRH